jgi:hypothetical protein
MLMIRAVGCVAVDKENRVPARKDIPEQALKLRAFQLHAVAVEVEILAVVADPNSVFRPYLAASVGGANFFIAVGVENGCDENHQLIKIRRLLFEDDISGKHQRGFFSFDFSGVDVGLNIDGCSSVATELQGRGRHRLADDKEGDGSAFSADAERFHSNQGALLLKLFDEVHDVSVS